MHRLDVYWDAKNKAYSFPLPNASIQQFIDKESLSSSLLRGKYNNSLPWWVHIPVCQQQDTGSWLLHQFLIRPQGLIHHPPFATVEGLLPCSERPKNVAALRARRLAC